MSLLTHLGFFATTKLDPNHGDQEGYVLTPSSRLLIKSELPNLSPNRGRSGYGRSMVVFVFDLPHVENLSEGKNLNYVGGHMFQSFPSADAIFFMDCVKILKRFREAIPSKEEGKVIIIDIVVDGDKDEHDITETKLVCGILAPFGGAVGK
ncbi:hypothetical protein TEA_018546 [Camellia sinensis var. sinensis]|uniref:O-methyltransferase C-terminal domain-containing protein n=1 Tax=Camellia sinensis var. sinensis TaxID=542762 RepID=A0A4S4EY47_CAMSN|nr:hypothetical protein TEA_018546 [Camellia sinensis var. sinensis]